jgi:hypothetical protein
MSNSARRELKTIEPAIWQDGGLGTLDGVRAPWRY